MELRQLRYFVALAEELNFTRAAKKLRLAQPSLTRQIRNLEEELGVRLLDRSKKRVLLTEHGHFFLTDARRIVTLSIESAKAVQHLEKDGAAQLNIGYLPRFDSALLPAALSAFHQTHPEIAVSLFELSPAEQFRALEARTVDLGFVGLRSDAQNLPLDWECVVHHEIVAALPASHPLAKGDEINLLDLKTLLFVAMSRQTHTGWRKWLSDTCEQIGFVPRIVREAESEADLLNFVSEGLGVALVCGSTGNLTHPGAVFRPIITKIKADYWIAWHHDNHSKVRSHFVEIVRDKIGESNNSNRKLL